jgi:hypothetical protein
MRISAFVTWALFLIWVVFTLWIGFGYGHYLYLLGCVIFWILGFNTVKFFSRKPSLPDPLGFARLFDTLFLRHPRGWALLLLLLCDWFLAVIVFGHGIFEKAALESGMGSMSWFIPGAMAGLTGGWGFALFR